MNGIILVNKPKGISSNAVVGIVRRSVGEKKCGHLGTLDLEGEGLLPVTVGAATKLFDFFLNKDKTYLANFVFGIETDTLDLSGNVVKQEECNITQNQVEQAALSLIGKQMQMPPQYSAKKVGGKVAYKEARKGNAVELKPKEIEIYSLKVVKKIEKNTYRFEISCSSGTYIRSLCRDLAEKMHTYGSMQCILRTSCGGFRLEDSSTIEEIKNGKFNLISCDQVFDFPKVQLDKISQERLLNGQILPFEKSGTFRLYGSTFFGVGKAESGKLRLSLRLI